jgi:hypothetical protein
LIIKNLRKSLIIIPCTFIERSSHHVIPSCENVNKKSTSKRKFLTHVRKNSPLQQNVKLETFLIHFSHFAAAACCRTFHIL